ncbi:MAG: CRISPR-associated endonuclease Cas3'', partial [Rubrivivax sp.]|nr:CRISPR-associated endonuclease Cas3'' [Rubrivivax sp.]
MEFLAHGPDHLLKDHLRAVGQLSALFSPGPAAPWADLAGRWHDLGKFRPGFQRYIRLSDDAHIEGRGVSQRDKSHSAAGALHSMKQLQARFGEPGRRAGWLLAHLIAAHHAGLYDGADLKERLLGGQGHDSEREYREAEAACRLSAPE